MVKAEAGLAAAPSSIAHALYVLLLALAGDADLAAAVAKSAAHQPGLVAWIALHRALLLAARSSKASQGPHFASVVLEFDGFNDHVAAVVKTGQNTLSAKASFLGASELEKIRMAILVSNVAIEVVRGRRHQRAPTL
ncbi:hypothetical protein SPRG_20856 [Saprolegnia parasitica CBS 223.65]|uniref:Uncharacterized protein n=1 Tax=Saprolegnia parasitica (strain CBS 223.65) TaxID=695850 RepID=A0A067C0X7_SAPPC|nr:hypothetical protein SPRG_20856 [Saprolegnia parasitica CBS 223.65]KDO24454.1 hypothetical protein SPRG_20856 [Saprolegnia parasitica CBS 223.65]|eukprot:XP_012204890.1 hypothetical protein SPRG_20856 [Saprolegnia parasitica CBS 223.65]